MQNRPIYYNYSFTLRSSFILEFRSWDVVPFRFIHFIGASFLLSSVDAQELTDRSYSIILKHLKAAQFQVFLSLSFMCTYHFVLSGCRRFSTSADFGSLLALFLSNAPLGFRLLNLVVLISSLQFKLIVSRWSDDIVNWF